jgi:hypothetical protein
VKLGVAAALARYLFPNECPFAVVFDLRNWKPSRPPSGSEWDYETFPKLEWALKRARELPADAEAEIWQYEKQTWAEAGVAWRS